MSSPSGRRALPVRRRRGPDWLHPGWSWTVGRAWVITALSASVTLILGAVLSALPALLAGSWLGLKLFGRLDEAMFRKVVLVLLLISGVTLII